jgi:hypothetical protein
MGIGNLGAPKKPDIDVSRKRIDISKSCVPHTRGRMPVMQ